MLKLIFSLFKYALMAIVGLVFTTLAMIGLGHVLIYLIHGENALKTKSYESDNILWL